MIAKDLMTHNPFVLYTSDSIARAADLFTEHKLSTIPVLTPAGEAHAVVSEIPLLREYIILKAKKALSDILLKHPEVMEPIIVVRERDSIAVVVQSMMKAGHHRVLVVDDQKHLKGVISPKDVLAVLHETPGQSVSMQDELKELRAKVTQLGQQQIQLKQTEQRLKNYESLISSSPFLFHSIDATGKIIMANDRIHDVLGYKKGELIGKTLFDIYPEDLWPEVDRGLQRVLMQGVNQIYTSYITKNRQIIRVEVGTQPITDATGNVIATSTIARVIDAEALLRMLNGVLK